MTREHIKSMIEQTTAIVCENYSGRGTFGKTCIGFVCPPLQVFSIISELTVLMLAGDDKHEMLEPEDPPRIFEDARQDQMGQDVIVYFPYLRE